MDEIDTLDPALLRSLRDAQALALLYRKAAALDWLAAQTSLQLGTTATGWYVTSESLGTAGGTTLLEAIEAIKAFSQKVQ